MKTMNLAVACMLTFVAVGGLAVSSVSADNSCQDDNSGYGYEPVSCNDVTCLEGEFFYVHITASNQNDYVEAEGSCDTADVACSDTDGECAKWSAAPATQGSHGGSCSGKAYVGNTGSVDLYCESGSSEVEGEAVALIRAMIAALLPGQDACSVLPVDSGVRMWSLSWSDNSVRRIILVDGVCTDLRQDLYAQEGWIYLNV